ncbi:hypothetical protein FB451DRAFT_1178763 [Mycena latifolia]|nr:hypothetical protein FB451DRAFT_1178763 [Mycena latifolia]
MCAPSEFISRDKKITGPLIRAQAEMRGKKQNFVGYFYNQIILTYEIRDNANTRVSERYEFMRAIRAQRAVRWKGGRALLHEIHGRRRGFRAGEVIFIARGSEAGAAGSATHAAVGDFAGEELVADVRDSAEAESNEEEEEVVEWYESQSKPEASRRSAGGGEEAQEADFLRLLLAAHVAHARGEEHPRAVKQQDSVGAPRQCGEPRGPGHARAERAARMGARDAAVVSVKVAMAGGGDRHGEDELHRGCCGRREREAGRMVDGRSDINYSLRTLEVDGGRKQNRRVHVSATRAEPSPNKAKYPPEMGTKAHGNGENIAHIFPTFSGWCRELGFRAFGNQSFPNSNYMVQFMCPITLIIAHQALYWVKFIRNIVHSNSRNGYSNAALHPWKPEEKL